MRTLVVTLVAIFLPFLPAGSAQATTYAKISFDGLCDRAELIFRGTVESVVCSANAQNRNIHTYATFTDVEWILPAEPPNDVETYTLRILGGTADGETLIVHGMPRFEIGSEYVVFVRGNEHYVCPVVGGRQGAFRITRDDPGGEAYVTNHDGVPIVGVHDGDIVLPTDGSNRARQRAPVLLDSFVSEIKAGLTRSAQRRRSKR